MNNRLQGKKIAVIGLGISNIAVVTYLLKQDLKKLSIFDTRTNPPYAEEVPGGIDFNLGPLDGELLKTYDMLVVSPGLSINKPELKAAADAGVEIVGDIELFASEVNVPVVGITGSNGKSTVTALVGCMLEKAGVRTAIGANFGNAVFDILSDSVETYVLELSSFELETTKSLHLTAGVILNVSEDHLDRYDGSIEAYTEAKHRIFQHCDHIIVNRDDPHTYPHQPENRAHIFASFGLDNDPNEYSREETDTTTYLCVKGQRVLDVRDLFIYGKHNELNALAAMALADAMGVPREVQVQALKTFYGLEHRCQLVRILDGVSFYNDSKATNVASAEAAITGLADRHKDGIILLAGGIGKGQDFTPLKRFFGHEVVKAYCFGRDAEKIIALDKDRCEGVLNMRQAIRKAFAEAKPGQAILLSPACSSFDQFKGFDERGRVFVNLVNNLTSIVEVPVRKAPAFTFDGKVKTEDEVNESLDNAVEASGLTPVVEEAVAVDSFDLPAGDPVPAKEREMAQELKAEAEAKTKPDALFAGVHVVATDKDMTAVSKAETATAEAAPAAKAEAVPASKAEDAPKTAAPAKVEEPAKAAAPAKTAATPATPAAKKGSRAKSSAKTKAKGVKH